MELVWDHYDSHFVYKNLKNYVFWDDQSSCFAPNEYDMQVEMIANALTLMGYNIFDMQMNDVNKETELNMADMYMRLMDVSNKYDVIDMTAKWDPLPIIYDPVVDQPERQAAVESGKLFPVKSVAKFTKNKKPNLSFQQFMVVQVDNMEIGSEHDLNAIKKHASIVLHTDDNKYSAWYHVKIALGQEKDALKLFKKINKNRHNNPEIDGVAVQGQNVSVVPHLCLLDSPYEIFYNCKMNVHMPKDREFYIKWWRAVQMEDPSEMRNLFAL